MFKIIAWFLMLLLAVGVSAYAIAFLLFEGVGDSVLKAKFMLSPISMYAHIIGGSIALVLGPFQLNESLQKKFQQTHRWSSRVYLTAVLVGGLGGLHMATVSAGGLPTQFGFGLLGVLWLLTGAMAYYRMRQGDMIHYRQWMIRNYALTLAAVTLRLYLPIFILLDVTSFILIYITVAWLCWVPNLIIAEWFVNRKQE